MLLSAVGCLSSGLESEMRSSIDLGKAAVVAKGGIIVLELEGRGVSPILEALDADPCAFADAVVMDRVVGRAAAAIYIVGRAREVTALVMSEGALELLLNHGVKTRADEIVPYIVNRRKTGMCPMDRATLEMENPEEIVARLRQIVEKNR